MNRIDRDEYNRTIKVATKVLLFNTILAVVSLIVILIAI
jgi:hypothetical protein